MLIPSVRELCGLSLSPTDIEAFSLTLSQFQYETGFHFKAGMFLNALMGTSSGSEFIIHTSHLEVPIYYLGKANTKTVLIDGDVGSHVGEGMASGSIIVKGNAGANAGAYMRGGELVIWGSADMNAGTGMSAGTITIGRDEGGDLGENMSGGTIIVNGRARDWIGWGMTGGSIQLNGDYVAPSPEISGGQIFHKGKLIWPKGGGSQ